MHFSHSTTLSMSSFASTYIIAEGVLYCSSTSGKNLLGQLDPDSDGRNGELESLHINSSITRMTISIVYTHSPCMLSIDCCLDFNMEMFRLDKEHFLDIRKKC